MSDQIAFQAIIRTERRIHIPRKHKTFQIGDSVLVVLERLEIPAEG